MNKKSLLCLPLLLALSPIGAAFADAPPAPPIGDAQRKAVIVALGKQLQSTYVFPDVARQLVKALDAKQTSGGYASMTTPDAFAKALSSDLRALGKDAHFNVDFEPGFHPHDPQQGPPSKEEMQQVRQEVASGAYGVQKVDWLPGNVGYMELRGFGPAEFVSDAFSSALQLLSGTDALILDLRRNGGGDPGAVASLMSHFFAEGDERHLNDLYSRTDNTTHQYWTSGAVGGRYSKPVYVLTSARTFSGGEECAYDFQTQKRATLVGETTGGGANPGDMYSLSNGFVAFIPNGRAINPVTHTNWEHVGVKPDVAVPAAKAQQTAYAAILRTLVAGAKAPEQRKELQDILAKVERGDVEQPNYTLRR